jgi:hypothetical protein
MWYIGSVAACAVWVFFDGRLRKASAVLWSIATAVLGPIVLPVYLAKRPLKEGEIREGGFGWHLCKNLALLWTILMGCVILKGSVNVAGGAVSLRSEIQLAGIAVGFGVLLLAWLSVLIGVSVIGLLLKKSFILERGPNTDALGVEGRPARGWLPWVAAAGFLLLLSVGQLGYRLYNSEGRRLHALEGDPPLVVAAQRGDLGTLKDLMSRAPTSKTVSIDDLMAEALEIAVRHDHSRATSMLMLDVVDRDATLRSAAYKGYSHAVSVLLSNGANPNAHSGPHWSAMGSAVVASQTKIVEILLAHGGKVNDQDSDRTTLLMDAANFSTPETLELLLANGAQVNAVDKSGMTALTWACGMGGQTKNLPRVIEILLAHGADPGEGYIHAEMEIRYSVKAHMLDPIYAEAALKILRMHRSSTY